MIAGGQHDTEKGAPKLAPSEDRPPVEFPDAHEHATNTCRRYWQSFERTLVRYNLEARGIQRVLPEHRHDMRQLGFMQIAMLWVSINLTANNLTLGMLLV